MPAKAPRGRRVHSSPQAARPRRALGVSLDVPRPLCVHSLERGPQTQAQSPSGVVGRLEVGPSSHCASPGPAGPGSDRRGQSWGPEPRGRGRAAAACGHIPDPIKRQVSWMPEAQAAAAEGRAATRTPGMSPEPSLVSRQQRGRRRLGGQGGAGPPPAGQSQGLLGRHHQKLSRTRKSGKGRRHVGRPVGAFYKGPGRGLFDCRVSGVSRPSPAHTSGQGHRREGPVHLGC